LRVVVKARSDREQGAWQVGPWPIDPAKIASREDVVRTFEHLSLLHCGYEARAWNHLAIASELGGDAQERRQAARQLAACYEQARYAPANEAMPAESIAAARRELCFLAGVASA
jgi:hypothetical protein